MNWGVIRDEREPKMMDPLKWDVLRKLMQGRCQSDARGH